MKIMLEDDFCNNKFVEDIGDFLIKPCFKRESFPCPRCGCPVDFPLIARKSDIDHFKYLIQLAEKYLNEKGVRSKIINDMFEYIGKQLSTKVN